MRTVSGTPLTGFFKRTVQAMSRYAYTIPVCHRLFFYGYTSLSKVTVAMKCRNVILNAFDSYLKVYLGKHT
jgi:hypothetical protein